jgi:hypothetical protein
MTGLDPQRMAELTEQVAAVLEPGERLVATGPRHRPAC